jgi:hypothetical protein
MNQSTGQGSDTWVTTTPGATNATTAGVVTGNGFKSGVNESEEWCANAPDSNEGFVPTLLRGLAANSIVTTANINYGESGGDWSSASGRVDQLLTELPSVKFDAIVVYLGINTAAQNVAQATYGIQFTNLMRKLVTNWPHAFILHGASCTLNNDTSTYPSVTYEPKVTEINTYISDQADNLKYLYYSDTFTPVGGHTIIAANWKASGNIHINSTGSNIVGDQLTSDFLLAKADWENNQMPFFGHIGTVPAASSEPLKSPDIMATYNSEISEGFNYTGLGTERITKAYAIVVSNISGSDADLTAYLYGADKSGGTWFNPEGQDLLSTATPITILDGATESIVEWTFPTPYEPALGEDIIGAFGVEVGGNVRMGITGAAGAFAYRSDDSGSDPWATGTGAASSRDFYFWFETQDIPTGSPLLTKPYPDVTFLSGQVVSLDLNTNVTGETSLIVSPSDSYQGGLSESSGIISGTAVPPTGTIDVTVTGTNSFGSISDKFQLTTLTTGDPSAGINKPINEA